MRKAKIFATFGVWNVTTYGVEHSQVYKHFIKGTLNGLVPEYIREIEEKHGSGFREAVEYALMSEEERFEAYIEKQLEEKDLTEWMSIHCGPGDF